MATNPLAVNSQWTPHDAPAQIETTEHDISGLESTLKTLAGKGEAELRNLYAEALHEESNAKQDLYMLRQRVATLGTDIQTNEEVLLASAKQRVASGLSYLKALELKIEGKEPVAVEPVQDTPQADDVPVAEETPVAPEPVQDTTPAESQDSK